MKQIIGGEARISFFNGVRELADFCKSCKGPSGRAKLVYNKYGALMMVSSSSQQLFSSSGPEIVNPFAKLVIDMAQQQIQIMGDGGLFTVGLAATLLTWTLDSELPRYVRNEAIDIAAREAQQYLTGSDCPAKLPLQWSDLESVEALIRSLIRPKNVCRLTEDELEHFCQLVLEAFLAALDEHEMGQPLIRTLFIKGVLPCNSEVIANTILLDTPPPSLSLLPTGPVLVALFDVSLMAPEIEMNTEMTCCAEKQWSPEEADRAHMELLASHLISLGVGVVACQKLVSPFLRRRLQQNSVCVLSRLSLRHIGAFQNISGAHVLSSWNANFGFSALGVLQDIKLWKKHGKDFVSVTGSDKSTHEELLKLNKKFDLQLIQQRKRKIATMIVGAVDQIAAKELELTLQAAIKALSQSLLEPHVFIGAGVWEFCLAKHLEGVANGLEHTSVEHTTNEDSIKAEKCSRLDISLTTMLVGGKNESQLLQQALKEIAVCIHKMNFAAMPNQPQGKSQVFKAHDRCCATKPFHSVNFDSDCNEKLEHLCAKLTNKKMDISDFIKKFQPIFQNKESSAETGHKCEQLILDPFTSRLYAVSLAFDIVQAVMNITGFIQTSP